MKTFADLKWDKESGFGGQRSEEIFDNGYGVSVINCGYGSEKGLYELAVLGKNGRLTYDTPVTDDVEGYLTPANVTKLMKEVAEL